MYEMCEAEKGNSQKLMTVENYEKKKTTTMTLFYTYNILQYTHKWW